MAGLWICFLAQVELESQLSSLWAQPKLSITPGFLSKQCHWLCSVSVQLCLLYSLFKCCCTMQLPGILMRLLVRGNQGLYQSLGKAISNTMLTGWNYSGLAGLLFEHSNQADLHLIDFPGHILPLSWLCESTSWDLHLLWMGSWLVRSKHWLLQPSPLPHLLCHDQIYSGQIPLILCDPHGARPE